MTNIATSDHQAKYVPLTIYQLLFSFTVQMCYCMCIRHIFKWNENYHDVVT